jgi:hypothetical protein
MPNIPPVAKAEAGVPPLRCVSPRPMPPRLCVRRSQEAAVIPPGGKYGVREGSGPDPPRPFPTGKCDGQLPDMMEGDKESKADSAARTDIRPRTDAVYRPLRKLWIYQEGCDRLAHVLCRFGLPKGSPARFPHMGPERSTPCVKYDCNKTVKTNDIDAERFNL